MTDRATWTVQEEATRLRPPAGPTALRSAVPVLAIILFAFLLHILARRVVDGYTARVVLDAGIAIMLAVSLNLVNGFTGQFSIGHAGFMALGGYTAAAVTYYGSLELWGTAARQAGFLSGGECLFVAACLAGGLAGGIAGYLVGLPTLRLRGDYLAIVTLGFGEIVRVLFTLTGKVLSSEQWKDATAAELFPPPLGGPMGISDMPKYTNLFWVYLFAGLTVMIALRLKFSSQGRMLISIREDEVAAQAMGVHVTRWKVRAFVMAAFLAGMAGGLYAHESFLVLLPRDAGFSKSFEWVIMVVLGGRGSVSGVAIAAALLTALPELLRAVDDYRMIVYSLLLILMMLLRPQGLLGMKEVWDYWPAVVRFFRKEKVTSNKKEATDEHG